MAVCNTFKTLSKKTGTFLTFSQYMEDLTAWHTKTKTHKVVPSKFIAIDCQSIQFNNKSLPKLFQDYFENACACFKNYKDPNDETFFDFDASYAKSLFWNTMIKFGIVTINNNILTGVQYVGDINLQSYNTADGMGYSEIYCHIPNEASANDYHVYTNDLPISLTIKRAFGGYIEGFSENELEGFEILEQNLGNSHESLIEYTLDKQYNFSWEESNSIKKYDDSFNINMIVVLYDIWNDNTKTASGIPLGIYITGLLEEGQIQNQITKYVSNGDIYNSGTSYGLRICSRYVASPNQDNYIVKEITCEDNNYSELNKVLSQLSISQNKMDEVINKTYNTEQNYKNLLAIFKNSRTNVPYIKVINNESYWFVNGKIIGPSVVDGIYDNYTNNEINDLISSNINQSFQVIASAYDSEGKYVFEDAGDETIKKDIIIKWDVYYEGKKILPTEVNISIGSGDAVNYSGSDQVIINNLNKTTDFTINVRYGLLKASTTVTVYFEKPIYFGELKCGPHITSNIHGNFDWVSFAEIQNQLLKYISTTPSQTYKISTDPTEPGHICYVYPDTFGELDYITDDDGYIYYDADANESDNQYKLITIKNIPYNIYIQKEPSVVYDKILKFKKTQSDK